jgi:hypothetical protein
MSPLERGLLCLAAEDYTGLWDAAAEAAKGHHRMSWLEAQRDASAALAVLLEQGLISLYLCEEPVGRGDIDELPPGKWRSTLAAGPHWNIPTPGVTSVRFLATELGSAASSLTTDPHAEGG